MNIKRFISNGANSDKTLNYDSNTEQWRGDRPGHTRSYYFKGERYKNNEKKQKLKLKPK